MQQNKWQQPAAETEQQNKDSSHPQRRSRSQPLRTEDQGATPQAAVTLNFLAVSLAPLRALLLNESKSIGVKSWLNIYVSEALKLMSQFKRDKREVLAFISNVDIVFEVINPENSHLLYKSVLTRISCEPRVTITYRNLENWDDLRTILKNAYT